MLDEYTSLECGILEIAYKVIGYYKIQEGNMWLI